MTSTRAAAFVIACLVVFPCHAFKVETHVLVAQEVINELARSKAPEVVFVVGDKPIRVAIDEDLRNSILKNQAFYRMGSIGPDALPGIAQGQMSIHPGSNEEWGTSTYLMWLLGHAQTSEEIAFAYGFLNHAATDVFAHTYVNQYAGDQWDFEDGDLVEQRHVALETFIASMNPPLLNAKNEPIKALGVMLRVGKKETRPAIPGLLDASPFMRRTFVLHPEIAEAYRETSPEFRHIYELWDYLREISVDGGVLDQARALIENAIGNYYLGSVGIQLTPEQWAEIRKLRDAQFRQQVEFEEEVDKVRRAANKLIDAGWLKNRELAEARLDDLNSSADRLHSELRRGPPLEREVERLESKIEKIERQLCDALPRIASVREAGGFGMAHVAMQLGFGGSDSILPGPDRLIPDPSEVEEWISGSSRSRRGTIMKPKTQFDLPDLRALKRRCGTNPLREAAKSAYAQAVRDRNAAVNALEGAQKSFRTSVTAFLDAIEQAWGIKKELDNTISDLHFYLNKGENKFVVKTVVVKWIDEIEKALDSYFVANARSIHPLLLAGDPKPLETWLKTDALKLVGTPPPIADNLLSLRDEFEKFRKKADQIDPVRREIAPELDRIQEEIDAKLKLAAREALLEELKRVKDIDVAKLLELMDAKSIDAKLERAFTSSGDLNLLTIPDIAARVRRDWGIKDGQTHFSRDSPAFRDAITLAKLSLLDCKGLNDLARQLGMKTSIYADGDPLYPAEPPPIQYPVIRDGLECYPPKSNEPTWAPCNVFRNWLRSIDGNHQWRADAPRYARLNGKTAKPGQSFAYGWSRKNPDAGLRIWEDSAARDAIFRKLFKGPISQAFESPREMVPRMELVLPRGYKYRGCREDPFPDAYPSPRCGE